MISMSAFRAEVEGELQKEAFAPATTEFVKRHGATLGHAAEIGGLGILAKPSLDELRGKKNSEKKKAKYELAGLGVLAAPSAIHMAHSAWKKFHP